MSGTGSSDGFVRSAVYPSENETQTIRFRSVDPHSGTEGEEKFSTGDQIVDWFTLDPLPRFLVDIEGCMVTANPAGEAVLRSAQIAASNTGMLKFGSAECDARFMGAVRQAMGRGGYRRAVLRQRDGGWLAVEVHGARGDDVVLVGLKEELSPSAEALDAISAAFQLTSSELAVLRCLLGGRCPKSAANDLSISEHTVRAHLRSIYSKMNVRGLNNTIRLACSFL